uniref:Uncharacterized protein n=1 Tax=Mycena chlorophos TaxID=658473 RepID=A0ABQ0L9W5_MYCCL|nr:predicted protein [Mycena chlorophos]
MNTDIGGIGVRVSFYLQTLFLSILSARSGSLEEIMGALYTLLFTNTAMAVTALILGFKPSPEISLQDAIVVFYLLMLSWVTVTLTLPATARFPATKVSTKNSLVLLHVLSVVQSYTIFAFAFALLGTAPSFGSMQLCNASARAVLFRPFSALGAGRILGFVTVALLALAYTLVLVKDHIPPPPEQVKKWIRRTVLRRVPDVEHGAGAGADGEQGTEGAGGGGGVFGTGFGAGLGAAGHLPRTTTRRPGKPQYRSRTGGRGHTTAPSYDLQIAWALLIHLLVVCILWTLVVMNTELLIRWNWPGPLQGTQESQWGFGQILPMFLVLLSFASCVGAFREFGLRPLPIGLLVGVGGGKGEAMGEGRAAAGLGKGMY